MIADYSFKPGWVSSVATAVLLPLFIALGNWQIHRAEEKEALLALRAEQAQAAELVIERADHSLDQVRYRPITARGAYDAAHQLLLDNQVHQGQAGYHVLTPLKLAGGSDDNAILVNRGWVGAGPDRRQLPPLPAGEEIITVSGIAEKFPDVAWRLSGAEIPSPGWPAVVQVVDPAVLSERLGYSILPYQVLLSPAEPEGYLRDWKPANVDPGKNRGYALQWFSFAAVLVSLFVWHGVSRKSRGQRDGEHLR